METRALTVRVEGTGVRKDPPLFPCEERSKKGGSLRPLYRGFQDFDPGQPGIIYNMNKTMETQGMS